MERGDFVPLRVWCCIGSGFALTSVCSRHAFGVGKRRCVRARSVIGGDGGCAVPGVRLKRDPLAPRESSVMLVDPLFSEGFQLVDRNAPCKEVVGRVNCNSKSRASVTKFRQGQCPGVVLVGWLALGSNASLGRKLELGAERACGGDLVFSRR
jgi:hypothetical protein